MKVFVIPSWYPTPARPLWANWMLPHVRCLRESGADVHILQVEPVFPDADCISEEPAVLPGQHYYSAMVWKRQKYLRTRFFYGAFLEEYSSRLEELYLLARDKGGIPDIIHAHASLPAGFGAAKLGRKMNVPVVVTEHYSGFQSDARFWWRVGHFVREMANHIQGFYAVSAGFAERIAGTGTIKTYDTLPNPVDTELFRPSSAYKPGMPVRIVTTGNLSYIKGTDILLEALKRLTSRLDWNLEIFGDASNTVRYSKWLNNSEVAGRVSLPGRIDQHSLARSYSSADVFVVSSRSETANVSMLEAMSCGTPIVSTRCGGPETLVNEKIARLVEPNDPEDLCRGILHVVENRDLYDRDKLREFVQQRYSKQQVSEKMFSAYRKAIHSQHEEPRRNNS